MVCWVLAMTYFRTGMTALSSAQRRFTVLFGMGRGGSNALWSPRIWWLCVLHICNTSNGMGGRSKEMIRLLRAFVITPGFLRFWCCVPKRSSFAGRFDLIKPRRNRQISSAYRYRVKPYGQLVSVSLTGYPASTSDLSTSWSRTTLQGG